MPFMTDTTNPQKRIESEQHADAVRQYLAAGGKIQEIPRGVMTEAKKTAKEFSYSKTQQHKQGFNQPIEQGGGKVSV